MNPCSAYCDPEYDIHTYLEWATVPASKCGFLVGRDGTIRSADTCMPSGTKVICCQVVDAVEAGERPSWIPASMNHPLLITMAIVSPKPIPER